MTSTFDGDLHVQGTLSSTKANFPADSISNKQVAAGAAIVSTKFVQRLRKNWFQGGTVVDDVVGVAIITGATGTIVSVSACLTESVCIGAAIIDIDLFKNGSTILSGTFQIDSADALRAILTGTISAAGLVVDDVLEFDINETTGGGTQGAGILIEVVYDEDPQ